MFQQLMADESTLAVPNSHKVHIRLECALALLKLSLVPLYEHQVSCLDFYGTAFTAQDPCYEVRRQFLHALQRHIVRLAIHARYTLPLFLVAPDPDEDLKASTRNFIARMMEVHRQVPNAAAYENQFPHLLHMLAHHPNFSRDTDDIKSSALYIEMFV